MTFDRAQLTAAAEVDPWALLAQLRAGDPAQIDELAAAFYQAGGDLADASSAAARSTSYVRAGYTVAGGAPLDYNAQARQTSAGMSDAADKLPKIAKLLTGVADDLVTATSNAATQVASLETALNTIDEKYLGFMQTIGHQLPPDDQEAARNDFLQDAIGAVRSYGADVNTTVMSYEHVLASASKSMSDLGYVAPVALREAGEQATSPLPVGTDPNKIAKWWAGLTPAQQEYLIDHDYGTLGQLSGLPAPVLDTANRHRLADDETNLKAQIAALQHNHADPDGSTLAALENRLKQDQGIDAALAQIGPGQPPAATMMLAYHPDGPDGQTGVAISFGNPDAAANTAVIVPGTGNNTADLSSTAKNGRDLYNSMTGQSKAVVVWLDGPEPQSVIPQAAEDKWANASAPILGTDLAGLSAASSAANGYPGHLTAIGHSYGSYILGKALSGGAKVDDAIFVGSPGVGVNSAKDLGMNPAHVWDGEASDDPILLTEKRFTPDPLTGNNPEDSDFGAQHFSVDGSHGHSQYYQGESLANMSRIASGNYQAVDRVDAPNYRGIKELPGDAISSLVNPFDAGYHGGKDLLTGHPIDAVVDSWDGAVEEGKDLINVGEDGVDAVESGVKKVWDWL